MYFSKINSLRIIPLNSNSNDCIKEYNYFYGLVDKYYPNKTNTQKIYLALDLCRVINYEKIIKQKLITEKKEMKKKSSFYKLLKKFISC
tara:strand:+ start:92 stop:358 length:267 start_codon:yes stop_codon:yes gene_type:complete